MTLMVEEVVHLVEKVVHLAEKVVHLLAAAFPQEKESEVHLVHPLKVAHY